MNAVTSEAKSKWKPNAQQLAIIEEFAALIENLAAKNPDKSPNLSDFCRRYLTFGAVKLGKILAVLDDRKPESYFDMVSDQESIVDEVQGLIQEINTDAARTELAGVDSVHQISQLRAILVAINETRNKKGPERLIKYLAPTGGGKSIVCNYLQTEKNARVVEAREAWKTKYLVFLQDICKALRIRLAGENRTYMIETRIIESLKGKNPILVIDEAEFFGAMALNGLKYLLNKTRLTIVICAIPEAHDRWNRYFETEALQITRRTHAVVELSVINPKDAALFFPKGTFTDAEKALAYLSGFASNFGHYSFLARLAKHLDGDSGVGKDTLEKACNAVRRQMVSER